MSERATRLRWSVVRALLARDLLAVRRSKAVVLPMVLVPLMLLVAMPLGIGFAARTASGGSVDDLLNDVPRGLAAPLLALPEHERLTVLLFGYLLAPLFLIVPLMVSSVLAADGFAGEKERKTMESLLHLPLSERELFVAKFLGAFLPALAVSWIGFALFCLVANSVSWPVMHRVFLPTRLWMVMILWVAPAVATFGLGVMVRVSAPVQTAQAANQLGGAVVLPLIFLAMGQATGLLLVDLAVAVSVGAAIWVVALWLCLRVRQRFTRDQLASRL